MGSPQGSRFSIELATLATRTIAAQTTTAAGVPTTETGTTDFTLLVVRAKVQAPTVEALRVLSLGAVLQKSADDPLSHSEACRAQAAFHVVTTLR